MLFLSSIDSATTEKILTSLEVLNKKTTLLWWIPIITAIITGILVWIGQAIDRSSKTKKEERAKIIELYGKLELTLIGIKNALKEIARHKSHRKYWWFCYLQEFHKGEKEENIEKEYEENSRNSAAKTMQAEQELNKELATYYSTLASYNLSAQRNIDLSMLRPLIEDYMLDHASDFPENTDPQSFCDSEMDRLTKIYFQKFSELDNINLEIVNLYNNGYKKNR